MNPQELPLVQAADLTFERSFPVNSIGWNNEPTDLTYGGQPLAVGVDGESLYFGCHKPNWFARVSIPPEGGKADFIEEGREIPYTVSNVDSCVVGGMMHHEGRLLSTKFIFYDAAYGAYCSHQASDDAGASWTTPARLGDKNPGYYAGYMCNVPEEWRELLGGPALTGQGILSIIGRTSFGPAAFAFDPKQVKDTDTLVPTIDLLYYTMDNPLHNPDVQNELFTRTDQLGGCFIVPGTRSLLFVGYHGMGPICYGGGVSDPDKHGTLDDTGMMQCYDPTTGAQGEHTYPYRGQVWAYDLNDLVRVKAGEIAPWDVAPYDVWALPGVSQEQYRVVRGGVGFNAADGRIYVAEIFWDSPRVDVFKVALTNTPPIDPPPTTDDCITNPLVVTDVSVEIKKQNQTTLKWTGPEDVSVHYDPIAGTCEFTDSRGCKVVIER
jgi:hypothetical protein